MILRIVQSSTWKGKICGTHFMWHQVMSWKNKHCTCFEETFQINIFEPWICNHKWFPLYILCYGTIKKNSKKLSKKDFNEFGPSNYLGFVLLCTTTNDKLLHTFGIVQQNCNKHNTKKDFSNFSKCNAFLSLTLYK